MLDVATGTGNAAIAAAAAGGLVTGLDLTPELFDAARRRAQAGGWEIEWIAGDAESLPFEDGSFDRVVSVFGAMFAPDHRQTARELVRVCRPGGTIGVCAWTPEGSFGRMIRLIMSRTPPPPDFKPPALWGNEGYVGGLFDGLGVELAFERRHVDLEDESPAPPHPHLTPRQIEVLQLLERGRSTAQIADELHLSQDTVRNHIRRLMRTLGAHSRLEAVFLARPEQAGAWAARR